MTRDDLKKALLKEFGSVLKPLGFKRRGQTFHHNNDDVVRMVFLGIQKSEYSFSGILVDCVQGIYSHYLGKHSYLPYEPKPNIEDSHWRKHLIFQLPENLRDKMEKLGHFHVQEDADPGEQAQMIREYFEQYALAELLDLDSTEKLRDFGASGNYADCSEKLRTRFLKILENYPPAT